MTPTTWAPSFTASITWNFAPGLAWANGFGYMVAGQGLDAYSTGSTGSKNAKDVFIGTSRIRFTF